MSIIRTTALIPLLIVPSIAIAGYQPSKSADVALVENADGDTSGNNYVYAKRGGLGLQEGWSAKIVRIYGEDASTAKQAQITAATASDGYLPMRFTHNYLLNTNLNGTTWFDVEVTTVLCDGLSSIDPADLGDTCDCAGGTELDRETYTADPDTYSLDYNHTANIPFRRGWTESDKHLIYPELGDSSTVWDDDTWICLEFATETQAQRDDSYGFSQATAYTAVYGYQLIW